MVDDIVNNVEKVLKKNFYGLTITEIVNASKLSRSAVRTALAKLDGAGKVALRKVGMAKIYSLKMKANQGFSFKPVKTNLKANQGFSFIPVLQEATEIKGGKALKS